MVSCIPARTAENAFIVTIRPIRVNVERTGDVVMNQLMDITFVQNMEVLLRLTGTSGKVAV